MVAIWPPSLPQRALREGFARSPADNRIVSDTDVDGGKARPRSSNAPEPLRLSMRFTSEQVELFWRFWHGDLGHGTGDFWFPAPAISGLALTTDDGVMLTTETGEPLLVEDWMLARFAFKQAPPTFEKRTAMAYVTAFSIEKLW